MTKDEAARKKAGAGQVGDGFLHDGEMCLSKCQGIAGLCTQFCGESGACCKLNEPTGVCEANMGCTLAHCCVERPIQSDT